MLKISFTILLFFCYFLNSAQFSVSNGTEIHVQNSSLIYSDLNLVNAGSIIFDSNGGELILDSGLDNSVGILTLDNAILKFGGGTTNADGPHTLTFNSTTDDTAKFVELNHNGTFDVSGTGFLNIIETFTSKKGILNAADKIVLVSSSVLETAIVPESVSGTINGIRVERYFPANRAWRFLSSPIASDQSIHVNWQNAGNFIANVGTHITGGSLMAGFDQNGTGNASLYTYDNSIPDWITYANTKFTNLVIGENYYTLVRGDRSVDIMINHFLYSPETVLRSTGSLHIGDFDKTYTTATDGFIATGNPYQSPVDMNEVRITSSSGFTDEMWVWQPGANNSGQYAHIILSTGTNSLPGPEDKANEFLQPSQAAFVQAAVDGPIIRYRENHKGVRTELTEVFSENNNLNYLRMGLYGHDNTAFVDIAFDGMVLLMDENYDTAVNISDGEKFFNNEENIAFQYADAFLTADKRAAPTDLDEVIDIYINNIDEENYKFSIELTGFDDLPNGLFLWDKYHDTYTSLTDGLVIPVTFDTAIPETTDNNRFAITFRNQTLSTNTNYDKSEIGIYPNTFDDELHISFGGNSIGRTFNLVFYDVLGKTIYKQKLDNVGQQVFLENLSFSSGHYFLNISDESSSHTFKLIKQ